MDGRERRQQALTFRFVCAQPLKLGLTLGRHHLYRERHRIQLVFCPSACLSLFNTQSRGLYQYIGSCDTLLHVPDDTESITNSLWCKQKTCSLRLYICEDGVHAIRIAFKLNNIKVASTNPRRNFEQEGPPKACQAGVEFIV